MSADKHPPSQDWFHNRFISREQHDAEIERLTAALADEREKRARLEAALQIIAGEAQCVDNLMGNVEIARAALSRTAQPEGE